MVTRENGPPKDIFNGKAPYLWAVVGCVFCVTPMLRAAMRHDWFLHTQNASPSFVHITAVPTVYFLFSGWFAQLDDAG